MRNQNFVVDGFTYPDVNQNYAQPELCGRWLRLTNMSTRANAQPDSNPCIQEFPTNLGRYVQLKGRHPMDLEVPVHVEGVGHQNPETNNQNPACRGLSM